MTNQAKKHQADAAPTYQNLFPDELLIIPTKKGLHQVAPRQLHG
ncbi:MULTISPECIES: hypothetical protein [unclassified Pseudomonas]|nr:MULTISPECIES: hypothetical protein [unclassified Pseudomonas]WPN47632.1 hypothetical protein QMK58_02820 [Pseudomonas sp. P8_241]